MHPIRYPRDASHVGLVGKILNGTTLACFAPVLERELSLLDNFEEFIIDFKAFLGDTDSVRTEISKVRTL